jgi:hypothetical protein
VTLTESLYVEEYSGWFDIETIGISAAPGGGAGWGEGEICVDGCCWGERGPYPGSAGATSNVQSGGIYSRYIANSAVSSSGIVGQSPALSSVSYNGGSGASRSNFFGYSGSGGAGGNGTNPASYAAGHGSTGTGYGAGGGGGGYSNTYGRHIGGNGSGGIIVIQGYNF